MTYGKQLLGALLFFIPRSIWPSKPFGSGYTVFTAFNNPFSNVSCPLIAEGYINFGLFGIIIFALMFGYLSSYLDCKFKNNISKRDSFILLYPFLLGAYFFMLRGDLMSSYAYLLPYIIIFLTFEKIFNKVKI